MTFILRFIGIITIACIGTGKDPCHMSPYGLRAYIPDGRAPHTPCLSGEATSIHLAYVRVFDKDYVNHNWSGRVRCHDQDDCYLYPLDKKDVIYIDGISNGNGMAAPFVENPKIRWDSLEKGVDLANDAIDRALATMAITAGTVKTTALKPNEMIVTEGTFTVPGPSVKILAGGKYVEVNGDAHVDIVNLPPHIAKGDVSAAHTDPHPEHFYLHYMLAASKPSFCAAPDAMAAPLPEQLQKKHLVASIDCSNSDIP